MNKLSMNCLYTFCIISLFSKAIKVNAQLPIGWHSIYTNSSNQSDLASSMAIDNDCNVYITGESDSIGTGKNIITIKYDRHGSVVWQAIYDNVYHLDDTPTKIKLDYIGNVYVCGKTGTLLNGADWVLIKYNSNGSIEWSTSRNSLSNGDDIANDLVFDNINNVYVCGDIADKAGVSKYDSSGNELWNNELFAGLSTYISKSNKILFSNSGKLIVMVHGNYNNLLQETNIDSINVNSGFHSGQFFNIADLVPIDFTLNSNGEAFILGYSASGQLCIYKSSGSGFTPLYYRSSVNNIFDKNGQLKVDSQNNIYITTYEDVNPSPSVDNQFLTAKFDYSGNLIWDRNYGNTSDDISKSLFLSGSLNPSIIVGGITTNINGDKDFSLIKYSNSGNLQTTYTTNFNNSGYDDLSSANQIDNFDNIFVTLTSGPIGIEDIHTIKYVGNSVNSALQNVNGDSLYCSISGTNFQWYHDGNLISAENGNGLNLQNFGNGDYYCSYDLFCNTFWSDTLHMTTVGTGKTIYNDQPSIQIYPNPSNNTFKVEIAHLNVLEHNKIQIYDCLSKLIYQENILYGLSTYSNSMNLDLLRGVYTFRVGNQSHKFIIN